MKLYYSRGACSLAPHIILEEMGIPYETASINLAEGPTPELLKVNPLGAVPVIVTDQGQVVTEVAVILQYLADLKPELKLAPKPDTFERYRLEEWLNFIATEIHKGFGPMFAVNGMTQNEEARKEILAFTREGLGDRFTIIQGKLGEREYLMPSGFSVADAYLFTILNWAKFFAWDISKEWPSLMQYLKRVRARDATQRAMKAEGLIV